MIEKLCVSNTVIS